MKAWKWIGIVVGLALVIGIVAIASYVIGAADCEAQVAQVEQAAEAVIRRQAENDVNWACEVAMADIHQELMGPNPRDIIYMPLTNKHMTQMAESLKTGLMKSVSVGESVTVDMTSLEVIGVKRTGRIAIHMVAVTTFQAYGEAKSFVIDEYIDRSGKIITRDELFN